MRISSASVEYSIDLMESFIHNNSRYNRFRVGEFFEDMEVIVVKGFSLFKLYGT